MHQRYLNIAWVLTAILVVWAIIAGNVDNIPSWTIAIPSVLVGFWWAFGKGFLGGKSDEVEATRAKDEPASRPDTN